MYVNRELVAREEDAPLVSSATLHGSSAVGGASNNQIFNNKLIQNNTQNKLDIQLPRKKSSIF